jgi:hypothetical protein
MEELKTEFIETLQTRLGLSLEQAQQVAGVTVEFAKAHKDQLLKLGGQHGGILAGLLGR